MMSTGHDSEHLAGLWRMHLLDRYGIALETFLACPDEILAWLEGDGYRPLLLKQRLAAQRWQAEWQADGQTLGQRHRIVRQSGCCGLVERRVRDSRPDKRQDHT